MLSNGSPASRPLLEAILLFNLINMFRINLHNQSSDFRQSYSVPCCVLIPQRKRGGQHEKDVKKVEVREERSSSIFYS